MEQKEEKIETQEEEETVEELFEAPEVETKEPFTVVGFPYHGRNPDHVILNLWERLDSQTSDIKYKVNAKETYGVMGSIDPRTGEFDFLVGYEVKKTGKLSEDLEAWDIPEQTYAVMPCTYAHLAEAVDYIYKFWLPESGYQRGEGLEFEFYGEGYDRDDEESELFLHVPVVKA
jgi:predicted transcriptional regulator YdeE